MFESKGPSCEEHQPYPSMSSHAADYPVDAVGDWFSPLGAMNGDLSCER